MWRRIWWLLTLEGSSLTHHFSLPSGMFTWRKRLGSEGRTDMWRDSFVIKAIKDEWVLQNIALCILLSNWAQSGKVSHTTRNKINYKLVTIAQQTGRRQDAQVPKLSVVSFSISERWFLCFTGHITKQYVTPGTRGKVVYGLN